MSFFAKAVVLANEYTAKKPQTVFKVSAIKIKQGKNTVRSPGVWGC